MCSDRDQEKVTIISNSVKLSQVGESYKIGLQALRSVQLRMAKQNMKKLTSNIGS